MRALKSSHYDLITPDFLLIVVIASSSGAFTPGPLFPSLDHAVTRSGWTAGVECAFGHMLVELPLVLGLAVGLSSYLLGSVRVIGVVGGATLFAFGGIQIIQARRQVRLDEQPASRWDQRSGVIVGLVFTGINPFFPDLVGYRGFVVDSEGIVARGHF